MYILYGGKYTRAMGVQMVLEEAGLPYELREIDIVKQEHRSDEFLAVNPAGYVPALITPEGDTLHETAAIMLYLADRHQLYDLVPPPDSTKRGMFYAKFFYLCNDVQPSMKRYYYPSRFSTDPADAPRVKECAFKMAQDRWDIVERHLAENGPCHLGEKVGLADFYMAVWAAFGFDDGYNIMDDHPAIRTCYAMVRDRPVIKPLLLEIENVREDYLDKVEAEQQSS